MQTKKKYTFIDSYEEPFQGRSGLQLERVLRASGIFTHEYNVANIDNFTQLPASIYVGFGKKVLQHFKNTEEISKYRGSFYNTPNGRILFTHHPFETLRGDGKSFWPLPASIYDLKKAKRLAENPQIVPHAPKVHVEKDLKMIQALFTGFKRSGGPISFDIETSSLGYDNIRCIGFSTNTNSATVIPVEQMELDERFSFIGMFREIFEDNSIKWVAQNGQFDINYMRAVWGIKGCGNYHFDTMFAHATVFPEAPHDLGTICSIYSDIPYYKNTSKEDLYHYNGLDCVATLEAYYGLVADIRRLELWDYYFDLVQELTIPLMDMSYKGIKIDLEYQKELKKSLKEDIKQTQKELDNIFQATINLEPLKAKKEKLEKLQAEGEKTIEEDGKRRRISSYIKRIDSELEDALSLNSQSEKQVKDYLFNVLKIRPVTIKGKVSTNKTALNKLYIKTQHPSLKLILKLRQLKLVLSNWGELETSKDGRVHTTYKLVETHRLSSGKFDAK